MTLFCRLAAEYNLQNQTLVFLSISCFKFTLIFLEAVNVLQLNLLFNTLDILQLHIQITAFFMSLAQRYYYRFFFLLNTSFYLPINIRCFYSFFAI